MRSEARQVDAGAPVEEEEPVDARERQVVINVGHEKHHLKSLKQESGDVIRLATKMKALLQEYNRMTMSNHTSEMKKLEMIREMKTTREELSQQVVNVRKTFRMFASAREDTEGMEAAEEEKAVASLMSE
jgi:hypothetical protein